eukprot:9485256-Pyramimonas_sp.AAC.1
MSSTTTHTQTTYTSGILKGSMRILRDPLWNVEGIPNDTLGGYREDSSRFTLESKEFPEDPQRIPQGCLRLPRGCPTDSFWIPWKILKDSLRIPKGLLRIPWVPEGFLEVALWILEDS